MKRLGIIICNYNKADMVVECIKCILENTFTDYDIYVVDNGSTDGSAAAIKKAYGDDKRVILIENTENLGGTGGFNTGLKLAYKKKYSYLMCVDNDAYLDENAISELYNFLEDHPECGMAASKIYHMETPGKIQQYGAEIDFDSFCTSVPDLNRWDDGNDPAFKYVDTVPACSLMIRRETIDKIGFMSEEFFLYWDDTDWCWRCWLAGLKVASVGTSYALHQMGAKKEAVNTFPTYYAWRNWIRFFMKYTPKDDYERMCRTFLSSLFAVVYSNCHKGEHNLTKTVMLAYDDALHGITGKAPQDRIYDIDHNYSSFKRLFATYKRVYIETEDFPTLAGKIKDLAKNTLGSDVVFESAPGPDIKTIKLCESIFQIEDMSLKNAYIDLDYCIFSTKMEGLSIVNYNYSLNCFLASQLPIFMNALKTLDINMLPE